jgi:hypothetical protein
MHWLDPDYLPEISGIFERFLINPHGDADGMILADGSEVHFRRTCPTTYAQRSRRAKGRRSGFMAFGHAAAT